MDCFVIKNTKSNVNFTGGKNSSPLIHCNTHSFSDIQNNTPP